MNVAILAFSANKDAAIPLAMALHSVFSNLRAGWTISATVIDFGLTLQQRRRLENVVKRTKRGTIAFVTMVEHAIEQLPEIQHFSLAAYGRLLLPELLPAHHRVIYLDADVFVNMDIATLWEADIRERPIAAAVDAQEIDLREKWFSSRVPEAARSSRYFNSGVLIIDLNQWRERDLMRLALEMLTGPGAALKMPDQDVLNCEFAGDCFYLPREWNLMQTTFDIEAKKFGGPTEASLRMTAIYHFAGPYKPWNGGPAHRAAFPYCKRLLKARFVKVGEWFSLLPRILCPMPLQRLIGMR